jgi:N-acetyl-gamma-glutamyl-phosphate reductase
MSKPVVFIDGEAGTTGLEIRKRLEGRGDIQIASIAPDKRKDAGERKRLLNEADLAILCLPDDAAKEAVTLVTNPKTKILDASSAHRITEGWAYGFPELLPEQEGLIRAAKRVSNPGCYPTGACAILRPLADAGILPRATGVWINAISGYSGGGKELIAQCEDKSGDKIGNVRGGPYSAYGLDQKHKHVPEMRVHGGLEVDPVFLPSYSNAFYRGMLIEIVLRMKDLNKLTGKKAGGPEVHKAIADRYKGKKYILVEPMQQEIDKSFVLSPLTQNETNNLQLRVFWNPDREFAVLTAVLDNLGKGASGAAVQNAEIMLGLSS